MSSPPSKPLNARQLAFVDAYTSGPTLGNATQAAIAAGYSPDAAAEQGYRLLRNAKVIPLIAERRKLRSDAAVMDLKQMQKFFSDLALDPANAVRDRISAAAWLGKTRGDFTSKINLGLDATLRDLVRESMEDTE